MKVFRRKGRDYYYYRTGAGGKKWVCTFETNKDKAEAIAREHAKATKGGVTVEDAYKLLVHKLDGLPEKLRDAQRIEYGQRLMQVKPETLAFSKAWAKWLAMPNKSKHGNPAPNTLNGYAAIWRRFEKWASREKIAYLHEVTEKHAEDYMADLWASGISERTYMAHLKQLRAMFKTLRLSAGILFNPFADITPMELGTQSRQAFTPDQLQTICGKAKGDWRYLVGIGIYTGLRLSDAVHLKWGDISGNTITVIPVKVARRKNKPGKKREVTIPIHPALAVLLAELRRKRGNKADGYLFPGLVREYAKGNTYVASAFIRFLQDDCGIETTADIEEGVQRKRRANVLGFHALRHSFVSMCAASNIPLTTVQAFVGHEALAMTSYYAHTEDAAKQTAIKLLPDVFNPPQK
ncbi:MAG TPA: tyrosine-type recombinase/integrase [Kiritimatiellia bacterium]|nr:tyrosine-type recombinase/integrase [Kiritimatiellia bacterium]